MEQEHVGLDEEIDLDRPGLIVICGPRLSREMADLYRADPVIAWEQVPDGPWTLRDTKTGTLYRTGAWANSSGALTPMDAAMEVAVPEFDGRLITVPFSFKEAYAEALAGDIRMNCDTCAYRVALPGFAYKVGLPQLSHYHPADARHHVHPLSPASPGSFRPTEFACFTTEVHP